MFFILTKCRNCSLRKKINGCDTGINHLTHLQDLRSDAFHSSVWEEDELLCTSIFPVVYIMKQTAVINLNEAILKSF